MAVGMGNLIQPKIFSFYAENPRKTHVILSLSDRGNKHGFPVFCVG